MTQPIGVPTPSKQYPNTRHHQTKPNTQPTMDDTVTLGFQWEAHTLVPNKQTQDSFFTTVMTHIHQISRPAIPIQFDEQRLNQLMQDYHAMVQQSRAPNVLLATYGWIKLNGLTLILLASGISFHELEKERKKAIKLAIEDNKLKFSDNEYNLEMIRLITPEKKAKKTIASLNKIRQELCVHMAKLGIDDWYTPERINRIQYDQVDRIESYFTDEENQLNTQKTHYYTTQEQPSITVRISDYDLDSIDDINQKLNRLAIYKTSVAKRKKQLDQRHKSLMGYTNFDTINTHAETLGLSNPGVVQ